jgi:hypothetical protein
MYLRVQIDRESCQTRYTDGINLTFFKGEMKDVVFERKPGLGETSSLFGNKIVTSVFKVVHFLS